MVDRWSSGGRLVCTSHLGQQALALVPAGELLAHFGERKLWGPAASTLVPSAFLFLVKVAVPHEATAVRICIVRIGVIRIHDVARCGSLGSALTTRRRLGGSLRHRSGLAAVHGVPCGLCLGGEAVLGVVQREIGVGQPGGRSRPW